MNSCMKKIILIFTLSLFTLNSFSQEYIFKFKVESKEEISKLTRLISIDNYQNGEITAYANQNEFDYFKTLGYDYQLLPHPSTGKSIIMATTVAEMANWDRYPTYDVYLEMMDDFVSDYPDLCQQVTIGMSEEGREIIAVKISDNVLTHEAEPEFFYTGTMHGDETAGFVLLLRLIDHLLSQYGTDSRITNIVNNAEIYINPAANPDGTYNSGNNTVSGATRSNSNGYDLNRNFPSPNLPNPSGMNESEIQSMITFAEDHHFVFSSNLHGGEEVVNFSWDSWYSSTKTHPDHNWLDHVSHNYADSVHEYSPASYMDGFDDGVTHGADWYLVDGSRQDHMCWFQHCREITLELSNQKLLDVEDLNDHWDYNRSAFLGFIEEMFYGFNGIVTDASTGDPLDAKIEIDSHDFDNSEVYTDPTHGDYYRPIEPGTYNVTYSAEGYISQTIQVTVSAWESTSIQNVQLEQAEQFTVSGTVTEEGTGNPLENVKIEFLNTSLDPVYTDITGSYSISNVFEGENQIKATLNGYISVTKTESISSENTVVDFILTQTDAISFESEIPDYFSFEGELDWTRVADQSYDGDYSVKSGGITHNQTSVMVVQMDVLSDGTISFYKKVSCENGSSDNWDYLKFEIDDVEKDRWDGEIDWSQNSYAVSEGVRTFKWTYSKDGTVSDGEDCAWVDYIEFPAHAIPGTYKVTFSVTDGTSPIQDAIVNFNSQNKNTDSNGDAEFVNIEPGENLPWTVSKTGYSSSNGTISVIDQDLIHDVTISEDVSVNVHLKLNSLKISPNPVKHKTNIKFNIIEKTKVYAAIYSYTGELIKVLDNSIYSEGLHQLNWDGTNQNKSECQNGLYICLIKTEYGTLYEKLILIK